LRVHGDVGFELNSLFRPIPGTILGVCHGFGLEDLGADNWRAVAVCASFTVSVQGLGNPPQRLELVALD
jgi:hypothetical protein